MRRYSGLEHLHSTALPGCYVETIYVSDIHHQLIFHELFMGRLLAPLAGVTECQEEQRGAEIPQEELRQKTCKLKVSLEISLAEC